MSGRIKRAIGWSLGLTVLAVVLALANTFIQNRDRSLALGPESPAQREFLRGAVDRPDIGSFFKRLTPSQKVAVARNLRRYDDPAMVVLATKWLTDFDARAREELAKTIDQLTPRHAGMVANQLTQTGGFQKLAIFSALRKSSAATLPFAIEKLSDPAARPNAVEYLVGVGPDAGSSVLTQLRSSNPEVRLAAADVLGKIAFRDAVPALMDLYRDGDAGQRSAFLAALGNIGDVRSKGLFLETLAAEGSSAADRASSILGLGRIGDLEAVQKLAEIVRTGEPEKASAIESLILAGDPAFAADLPVSDLLEVARGIESRQADMLIAQGLESPGVQDRAAAVALGRPGLALKLKDRLASLDPSYQGRSIEILIKSLASTDDGRALLKTPEVQAKFGGFVQRELAQAK